MTIESIKQYASHCIRFLEEKQKPDSDTDNVIIKRFIDCFQFFNCTNSKFTKKSDFFQLYYDYLLAEAKAQNIELLSMAEYRKMKIEKIIREP